MNPSAVFMRAACAATLASVGSNALSLPGPRMIGHYDFGYAIRGDRAARPAQVFDDGAGKVYFEARPGQPMPAVFAGPALDLLVLQAEGQFFTALTGASEFTLVLGAARATVARGDAALGGETMAIVSSAVDGHAEDAGEGRLLASAAPGLPAGVRFDMPGPSSRRDAAGPGDAAPTSYAMPLRGDTIEWIAPGVSHTQVILFDTGSAALSAEVRTALAALAVRIGHDASVVIGGRGDASRKEGLARARASALCDALVAGGLPAKAIRIRADGDAEVAEPSGGRKGRERVAGADIRWTSPGRTHRSPGEFAPAPVAFDLRTSDADIANAVRRWARGAGYDVVWDLEWTAPITGRAHLDASSFTEAVQEVVAGLRSQGYPVRAQAYADRVVRFSAPE
jgi:outer membrane protein OmpA-like peptidoglycan-associated protein